MMQLCCMHSLSPTLLVVAAGSYLLLHQYLACCCTGALPVVATVSCASLQQGYACCCTGAMAVASVPCLLLQQCQTYCTGLGNASARGACRAYHEHNQGAQCSLLCIMQCRLSAYTAVSWQHCEQPLQQSLQTCCMSTFRLSASH